MGVMSEVAKHADDAISIANAKILIYSDDKNVREKVRFAVGSTTHGRTVEWTEAATHDAVIGLLDTEKYDLVVLDGEAAKSGGMGICRQMKHEYFSCPPVLLLVGRPGDAWLATWSEADAAVAHPLDPFVLRDAVDEFFVPAAA
jgi:DNA-binding response OmpR family regulator